MKMTSDKDVCCFPFNPVPWDKKTHVWRNKLFLKDTVIQFLHIPLNVSSVVTRMFRKVEAVDAAPEVKDFLLLAYDPSPWKSEIFMTVTKAVADGEMVKLSGTFVSKVFDGPYHMVPKWMKEMDAYVEAHHQSAIKYYFHFAYCPKCAQKYGHNFCVAFAQVQ